ncbi:MAG: DUF4998 domain-containing protein [Bacteroidota bacterium]|nr:DUF4998 domain-containing protein [Bacteroidota bacterium]
MKTIYKASFLSLLILAMLSCNKYDTDYKSFFGGHEIIYPGPAVDVTFRPGNLRTALLWHPSPDPSVKKYVVYWNNKADSVTVNATSHSPADTMKVIIPNLKEYIYSFTINSYDSAGNKSIPKDINNVKVYGPVYQVGLLNRPYNADNPYLVNDDGSVNLNFNTPDTINISTAIRYTNNAGNTATIQLAPTVSTAILPDYKAGTTVSYNSSYIPVKNAIDTFKVSKYDDFPRIYKYIQCDKSLFAEMSLPNDLGRLGWDSNERELRLWDESVGPQSYPWVFHSDGSQLPGVITFDMGKVYSNLARIEETGRDCCNNPDDFEVWGTADITNAITTLPSYDPGWPAEAAAKGWTLLKEVVRTDDGKAPFKVDLNGNLPPVRYIRLRFKHTVTGSNYVNLSEVTFWNKQ